MSQNQVTGHERQPREILQEITAARDVFNKFPREDTERREARRNLALLLRRYYASSNDERTLTKVIDLEREELSLCPPGHPDRDFSCRYLALSLRARYDRSGDDGCLTEAIELMREALVLRPPGHPHRAISCQDLAKLLDVRYCNSGDERLLSEAIDLEREALLLRPQGHPHRGLSCQGLALALITRWKPYSDGQLLPEIIDLLREFLTLLPEDHSDCAFYRSLIAKYTFARYQYTNNVLFLNEAIDLTRQALLLCPPGHIRREECCCDLAKLLYARATLLQKDYVVCHDEQLMSEAIKTLRESVVLLPPDDPDRASLCCSLSVSLTLRYQRSGDEHILSEVVDLERETLNLRPPGHPGRATSCQELAMSLQLLHQQSGGERLLSEAIELLREILVLCPQGHFDRASCCRNLASSLRTSHKYYGNQQHLSEAIDLMREALLLCPRGHPDFASHSCNLAISLHASFEHSGNERLLAEAIDLQQEALAQCLPGHRDRAGYCHALAISLNTQYDQSGDLKHLSHTIDLLREALSLCPDSSSNRAHICRNLAGSLHARYKTSGDEQLLSEAIALQRESVSLCSQGHPDHLRSTLGLATLLWAQHEHSGDEVILTEVIQIESENLQSCPSGHPLRGICCRNLAVSLVSRYGHSGESDSHILVLSVIIKLEREALSLCSMGHPDYSLSCRLLATSLHHLYNRTKNEDFLQEAIALHQSGLLHAAEHKKWRHGMGLAQIYLNADSPVYDIEKGTEWIQESLRTDCDVITDAVIMTTTSLEDIWRLRDKSELPHVPLAHIYQRLVLLLPLLVSPALEARAQLYILKHCGNIGPDAFLNETLTHDHRSGLEVLELTQGLIWSQRLHYRDPQLDDVPAHLENQLRNLITLLNQGTGPHPSINNKADTSLTSRDVRHSLSIRIQALVQEIRSLPGLNRFMLGESFDALCTTASKYPAVVLVHARGHSFALVLAASSGCAGEDNCSLLPLDITIDEMIALTDTLLLTRQTRSSEDMDTPSCPNERGFGISFSTSLWPRRMRMIWEKIVYPILNHLGLSPSTGSSRPRLYWCPTGIVRHLPLHAAGIHDGPQRLRVTCSDYIVSSYTPTLTTLLRAQRGAAPLNKAHISLALIAEKRAQETNLTTIAGVDVELKEVEAVATSAHVPAAQLIAGSTTTDAVSAAIQTANMIHLACHGVQDTEDATQSGFCLGNGRLTIEHLMGLGMSDPFLAFLSACETAKGDVEQPDQVMHLAAAMLFCGFKSVVATMWAINDSDGPKVAKWFYEELFKKETTDVDGVAYALDIAVSKLRDSGMPPDRWAPFIHMGA